MSMLSAESRTKVAEYLVSSLNIDKNLVESAHKLSKDSGKTFLQYLVDENIISSEQLAQAVAKVGNIPYVNLSEAVIDEKVLDFLSKDIAERYMAVPLGQAEGRLAVAMLDANNVQAVDYLSSKIGKPITVYLASETGIRNVLSQYKTGLVDDVSATLVNKIKSNEDDESSKEEVKTIVQDSPISKALSAILDYAAGNEASDVHIEPREDNLKIRARIDGILTEIMTLPKSIEPALISRIKILSNLKIDEHRIPQDGGFKVKAAGKSIDLRIAISPVVWGEQVVIRLLDQSGGMIELKNLGFAGQALRSIKEGISRPNGMIISSGPTGSGKSTTLYALINEIISDEINIVTLEDPVEYKMDRVNQIQINPDVGLTFASGLRSILRQDPDVVMVGEIRDKETAQLAVQAALTGHLVFSTLHTNSAAGVLPRLLDMDIEPFLIASTVNTIIGQRLVRKIGGTQQPYDSSEAETATIKSVLSDVLPKTESQMSATANSLGYQALPLSGQNAYTLYKGVDSAKAPGGYKGRTGIYEVFNLDSKIEKLVVKRSASIEIQQAAREQGMLTMRQDGYLKALAGITTVDEVNRVAAAQV
ncbi:Flp pilus assembly complex ATPase component TadA [Candidatus Saccharibacteria bacterium]|jgi:type IV pilus assembly protein PilB|nr:Flp pilus assembly complex ATPase component TadA [Candidatus Saccharibacteria bacterium]MBP9131510.1 Flp pilus assembly complex ATPase component TadA [Candidatus Saccharibacteria bacterium]